MSRGAVRSNLWLFHAGACLIFSVVVHASAIGAQDSMKPLIQEAARPEPDRAEPDRAELQSPDSDGVTPASGSDPEAPAIPEATEDPLELSEQVKRLGNLPDVPAVDALAKHGLSAVEAVREVHGDERPVYFPRLVRRVVEFELRASLEEASAVRFEGQFSNLSALGSDGARALADFFLDEDQPIELRRRAGAALGDIDASSVTARLTEACDDFLTEFWVVREASYVLARNGVRKYVEGRLQELAEVAKQPVSTVNLGAILAAYDELGEIHHRLAEYEDAIRAHEKRRLVLQEIGTRLPEALRTPIAEELNRMHYDLACSLARAGRFDEAVDALIVSRQSPAITEEMVAVDGDLEALRSAPAFDRYKERNATNPE